MLWMYKILHHFDIMENHCSLALTLESTHSRVSWMSQPSKAVLPGCFLCTRVFEWGARRGGDLQSARMAALLAVAGRLGGVERGQGPQTVRLEAPRLIRR